MMWAFIGFALCFYFVFHLVQGERWYFSLKGLQKQKEISLAQLEVIQGERKNLQQRVEALRTQSMDFDLLEERARILLDLTHSDEVIIFTSKKS